MDRTAGCVDHTEFVANCSDFLCWGPCSKWVRLGIEQAVQTWFQCPCVICRQLTGQCEFKVIPRHNHCLFWWRSEQYGSPDRHIACCSGSIADNVFTSHNHLPFCRTCRNVIDRKGLPARTSTSNFLTSRASRQKLLSQR